MRTILGGAPTVVNDRVWYSFPKEKKDSDEAQKGKAGTHPEERPGKVTGNVECRDIEH